MAEHHAEESGGKPIVCHTVFSISIQLKEVEQRQQV